MGDKCPSKSAQIHDLSLPPPIPHPPNCLLLLPAAACLRSSAFPPEVSAFPQDNISFAGHHPSHRYLFSPWASSISSQTHHQCIGITQYQSLAGTVKFKNPNLKHLDEKLLVHNPWGVERCRKLSSEMTRARGLMSSKSSHSISHL